MSQQVQSLVSMINDPTDLLRNQAKQKELIGLLNDLAKSQLNPQLEYDGDATCALSGELIKDQPTQEVQGFKVLKSALEKQVLNYAIPGILDESLNYIEFNAYQNGTLILKQLPLTEEILTELFGVQKLKELRQSSAKYFDDQMKNHNPTFTCPITNKTGYIQTDGINVQGIIYSIEGASQLMRDNPDSFQPAQKEIIIMNYTLTKLINNPNLVNKELATQLIQIVNQLTQQKQCPNLVFDGSTTCSICLDYIGQQKSLLVDCGHQIHHECFRQYALSKSNSLDINEIKSVCNLTPQCSQYYINNIMLDQVFGSELIRQMQEEANRRFIEELQQMDKAEQRKRESNVKFMCMICTDEYSVEQECVTFQCNHKFCRQCTRDFILQQINSGKFLEQEISCPQNSCNTPISIHEIKAVAPEFYNKIIDLRSRKIVNNHTDLKFIQCNGPQCVALYEVNPKTQPTYTCVVCKNTFCSNGCPEAHKGITCEQFQQKLRKQIPNAQQCSKCKVMIVKEEGCNHITCQCKHEFCYLCGADWKPRKCKCLKNGLWDRFFGMFG